MGELLPFRPRTSIVSVSGAWNGQGTPLPNSREVVLELGPGGSLAGATTEEQQRVALAANPMRRLVDWRCDWCQHTWVAPAAARCPKCHDSRCVATDERVSMAQRLK